MRGPGLTIVREVTTRLVESCVVFSQLRVDLLAAFTENRKSFSRFWFRPLV